MNVSLTPDLEKLVAEEVASGMYPTRGEVIRHALRLLKERGELRQAALAQLRDDLQLGIDAIDRGEVSEYDQETIGDLAEEIKARGMRRLAQQRGTGRDE